MRKPVYAICEQQRHKTACAYAQSGQRLCFRCLDSIIPLVSLSEISSLYLASVAAQAGLSLPWSQSMKTDFLVTKFILPKIPNGKGATQTLRTAPGIIQRKRKSQRATLFQCYHTILNKVNNKTKKTRTLMNNKNQNKPSNKNKPKQRST